MEEGKKKMIMVAVIVACIATAVIITLATRNSNTGTIDDVAHEMMWLKCRDCGNAWQMDKKEFLQYVEKYRNGMQVPGVECPKCHKKDGYRAEKCEKCGNVFEKIPNTTDYPDRCPKCGFSALEDKVKKARGEK
jgi:DNA-directed RNA polymerase subunit RPC12/RpoP